MASDSPGAVGLAAQFLGLLSSCSLDSRRDPIDLDVLGLRDVTDTSPLYAAAAEAAGSAARDGDPTLTGPQRADAGTRAGQARSALHVETGVLRQPTVAKRSTATSPFRHWLATINVFLAAFVAGAFTAPILTLLGWRGAADALYAAYHLTCHQWAFRSFFLFAPGQPPLVVYSQQRLADLGTDPFSVIGSADLGWKMAFCERDLAIYIALLAAGLYYARRRDLRPASFLVYGILILPMALDGFTQLFGWRESTWQLRVVTGLLFGLASGWLVLPRLDVAFGLQPANKQYAPETLCDPAPLQEPRPQLSPRG